MKYDYNLIEQDVKLDFIFDGLHRRNIGIIAGIGAVGKSYFILEQLIKHYLNIPTMIEIKAKKTLFLTTEDEQSIVTQRIQNILKTIYNKDIKNNENKDKIVNILKENLEIHIANNQNEINEILNNFNNIDLLILDTLSVVGQLNNENDNAELSKKLEKFKEIARQKDIAILFIHHLSQAGIAIQNEKDITADKVRGATTLLNNSRYVAILSKAKECLVFKVVKNNYGKYTIKHMDPLFWDKGFISKIQVFKKGRKND